MSKQLFLAFITFYQKIVSPLLKQLLGVNALCRYSPSCSTFAIKAIKEHGTMKGGVLAIKRILSCQPFAQLPINHTNIIKNR